MRLLRTVGLVFLLVLSGVLHAHQQPGQGQPTPGSPQIVDRAGSTHLSRGAQAMIDVHGTGCKVVRNNFPNSEQLFISFQTRAEWISFLDFAAASPDVDVSDCLFAYTNWTDVGSCSATCGGGAVSQTRSCTFTPTGQTVSCSYCGGQCSQTAPCNAHTCPSYQWQQTCPQTCALDGSRPAICGRTCTVTCHDQALPGSPQVASANCPAASMPAPYQTCPVNQCPLRDCVTPWGAPVPHGSSVTAFAAATSPQGQPCQSETRTCTNGVLSGSFAVANCTAQTCPLYWMITGGGRDGLPRCPNSSSCSREGEMCQGVVTIPGNPSPENGGGFTAFFACTPMCTNAPSCTPRSETRTVACPSGQTGAITERRDFSCPIAAWSPWTETSRTCATTCTPTSETRTVACPSGQSGQITQRRDYTCPAAAWGNWTETGRTCVTPCTPTSETRTVACPSGQTGTITQRRDFSCPIAAWSSWTEIGRTCSIVPEPDCIRTLDPLCEIIRFEN